MTVLIHLLPDIARVYASSCTYLNQSYCVVLTTFSIRNLIADNCYWRTLLFCDRSTSSYLHTLNVSLMSSCPPRARTHASFDQIVFTDVHAWCTSHVCILRGITILTFHMMLQFYVKFKSYSHYSTTPIRFYLLQCWCLRHTDHHLYCLLLLITTKL
jgi:hypothetical protein